MKSPAGPVHNGTIYWLALLLVWPGFSAFAPQRPEPAAIIVSVTGSVQVQRPERAPAPAGIGTELHVHDRLLVATGARALVLHRSGQLETVTTARAITDPAAHEPAGRFRQVMNTVAQLATTNARSQPNRQGMIRPVPGEPLQVAPRNGLKVATSTPVFTWLRGSATDTFVVQVRRVDVTDSRPERFRLSGDTSWTYPATAPALLAGAEYEWVVGAAAGGRVAPPQRFRIATAQERNAIAELEEQLQAAGAHGTRDGRFVLAIAFRDAGLLYDAERVLRALAADGARGRTFLLLRAEVLDALGDVDAAARAFAAADAEPVAE